METVSQLIQSLGGNTAVGKILGKGQSTVSEMKRNGSIGVEYWPRIIEAAAALGVEGVTADFLMRLHAREAAE